MHTHISFQQLNVFKAYHFNILNRQKVAKMKKHSTRQQYCYALSTASTQFVRETTMAKMKCIMRAHMRNGILQHWWAVENFRFCISMLQLPLQLLLSFWFFKLSLSLSDYVAKALTIKITTIIDAFIQMLAI